MLYASFINDVPCMSTEFCFAKTGFCLSGLFELVSRLIFMKKKNWFTGLSIDLTTDFSPVPGHWLYGSVLWQLMH